MTARCKFPNCKAVLSAYNMDDNFCFLHQRVLGYNDVEFKDKKFYKATNHKSKAKLIRIMPRRIARMKAGVQYE